MRWDFAGTVVTVDDRPRLVQRTVAGLSGIGEGDIEMSHRCPHCGGTGHGQPFVNLPFFVSASHCAPLSAPQLSGPHLSALPLSAAAVSDRGPVGVDIESVRRLSRAAVDDVLLHPRESRPLARLEPSDRTAMLTRLWSAKEAILKLTGVGLVIEPRDIQLEWHEDESTHLHLVSWPDEVGLQGPPTLHTFAVSEDVVGTLALGLG